MSVYCALLNLLEERLREFRDHIILPANYIIGKTLVRLISNPVMFVIPNGRYCTEIIYAAKKSRQSRVE